MRLVARSLPRVLVFLALFSLAVPVSADRPSPTPGVPAGARGARHGVVAVSHPLAADAGARMLEDGGNAVDAAVAIQLALNVVEPQSSGIGGGGFMMIHLARTGETFVVDSREQAPAAATRDMFGALDFTSASTSGISVGVPGTLAGLTMALRRWGTMPLREVMAPAIELAEHGFPVNAVLEAEIVDTTARGVSMTTLWPETACVFRPGGVPLRAGDVLVQPDLARTLKLIARHGPRVFYEGAIAQDLLAAQQRTRAGPTGIGRMTAPDLSSYRPRIRQPIVGRYRGYTVASMSPPSSGALTILQMLKMMERFPVGDPGQGYGFGSPRTLHVMIDAMRLAFSDRAVWMGDADFVHVPVAGLLDPAYVASRSALIRTDPDVALTTVRPGNPLPFDVASAAAAEVLTEPHEGVHTTHLAVVDRWDNVVTWTTTIESAFGTGMMAPRAEPGNPCASWGFLLNNELTDFNMAPTTNPFTGEPGANDVQPGKRPRSSMSPTLLLRDGRPFAAYGSPGGATIINSVLQITMNLVDHGMAIQEAIDAPRISTAASGVLTCEAGALSPLGFVPTPAFTASALQGLRDMGHTFGAGQCRSAPIGSVQAVIIDLQTGKQYGGADHRREGTVIPVRLGDGHGR